MSWPILLCYHVSFHPVSNILCQVISNGIDVHFKIVTAGRTFKLGISFCL